MDIAIKIWNALKWPLVVVILGNVVIRRLTPQLGRLIDRVRKITPEGIETEKINQQTYEQKKKSAKELLKLFDNRLIREAEEKIKAEFETIKHTQEEKEELLMKWCASERIAHLFDQIYNLIFGSQILALYYLNSRVGTSVNITQVKPYYDKAKIQYPLFYKKYPFEKWLRYLENTVLIIRNNDNIGITIGGQEFLKYLIDLGLTSNKIG